jgi:DHA3 family tetracycline resistance protein-like MFS transporter
VQNLDAYTVHLTRSALSYFAQTLVRTAMLLYHIQYVGLTPLQLVLVGTTLETTVFLCEIPTGIIADVYSRRLSVILGTFLMGSAYLVAGVFPTFAVLLLSNVLWGLGYTCTSGAYEAWLVDELGPARAGEAFLRAGQVARAGAIVAIPVSAGLGSHHLALPILVGAVVVLLTGGFLLLWMPEHGFSPTPAAQRTTWQTFGATCISGLRVLCEQPALGRILAVGVFYGLFSEAWDRLWQLHLLQTIGMPQWPSMPPIVWFSMLAIGEMSLGIVAAEVVRRRLNLHSSTAMRRGLFWMTAMMVAGLVVYGVTTSLLVALLAFFAFTSARGLTEPVYRTWANMHIDSRVRATVLSMQSQTDAIGQIVGGPPLGALGERRLPLAFLASAVLLTPALWLLRCTQRPQPDDTTSVPRGGQR